MTMFNEREDAFERQFAHDEALRFKATARRNKLLGLWAAERLGRTGEEGRPMPGASFRRTSRSRAIGTCSARSSGISRMRANRWTKPI